MKNTIIQHYGLDKKGLKQKDVEFFNLRLDKDNRAYVDHNKIIKIKNPLTRKMQKSLDSYLTSLFGSIHSKKDAKIRAQLKGLHETNSTKLALSKGDPKGNSVGSTLQKVMMENLKFVFAAISTGHVSMNTLYFGIDQIGPDRISDIVVSIIKEHLIKFTQEQCSIHKIATKPQLVTNLFNTTTFVWEKKTFELPQYDGFSVIFIPKILISRESDLTGTYNSFIRFGFRSFVKFNKAYSFLVDKDNKDKGVLKKDYDQYIQDNGIKNKDEIKDWLIGDPEILINFQSYIDSDISVLDDDELENILE